MSTKSNSIDQELYSRQIYVLGEEAMKRMNESSVLLIGLKGVGVEIAKDIILAGVHNVSLYDNEKVEYSNLSSNFYLTENDIGKPRAQACYAKLNDLNPYVSVSVCNEELSDSCLSKYRVIVMTEGSLDLKLRISNFCHEHNICFILSECCGVFSRVFCDFGENWISNDLDGEEPSMCLISNITNEKNGIVTVLEEKRHNLSDGDYVIFDDIQGMTELNKQKAQPVKVITPYSFSIGDTSNYHPYTNRGYFLQVKQPTTLHFKSFNSLLLDLELSDKINSDNGNSVTMHIGFQGLDEFRKNNNNRYPNYGNRKDAEEVLKYCKEIKNKSTNSKLEINEELITRFALQCKGEISPFCAAVGGVVGQEVLKACSNKYTPINQFFYLDCSETLPNEILDESEYNCSNNRYEGEIGVYGRKIIDKLLNLKYFLVGAGAIGCEVLKNFAMMGVGCGEKGQIYITDMDLIEKSNLSRQFLFRNSHIKQPKSKVASESIIEMNKNIHIKYFTERVGNETENIFDDKFMNNLDGICNALDNVEARLYMDGRCLEYQKPLLESGTLGTKGNTQIVVPFLTESYGDSNDQPESSIPICTLKNFPHKIEHTIQWARDYFEGQFTNIPSDVNSFIHDENAIRTIQSEPATAYERLNSIYLSLVCDKPLTFEDCIKWSRLQFEELFCNNIKQLLCNFPKDYVSEEGIPFWIGEKRAPNPLIFDINDPIHLSFVVACSNLRAFVYGLNGSSDINVFKKVIEEMNIPPFIPVRSSDKPQENNDPNEVIKKLPKPSSLAGMKLNPITFEKDDDTNYHMQFISATSNLRARNYEIPEVDMNRTKLIAGNIIPAISTTTAFVSGLITMEIYSLLQNKSIEGYRNGYCNLALPIFQLSEPVECSKRKYKEYEWSNWSKIDLKNRKSITLQEFIDFISDSYDVNVEMISYGASMIYSLFTSAAKLKTRLPKSVVDVICEIRKNDDAKSLPVIPLDVSCSDNEGNEVILPTVRLYID